MEWSNRYSSKEHWWSSGGKFHVPSSIFQRPPGVTESLWSVLSDESATVADIIDSLIQIVEVCFKNVVSKKRAN